MSRSAHARLALVWRDRALIPNRDGFRVVVLRRDGGVQRTRVVRDAVTGLHSLQGIEIEKVAGWRDDWS